MSKRWYVFAWCALAAMWASSVVLGIQLYRSINSVGEQLGIVAQKIEAVAKQQSQPMQTTSWTSESTQEEIRSPKLPAQGIKPWLDEHFLRVHQAQEYRPPIEKEK